MPKMAWEYYTTLVLSVVLLTYGYPQNRNDIYLPLLDTTANAELTATIDMTKLNTALKDYIDNVVKDQVMASLNDSVSVMFNRMEDLKTEVESLTALKANVSTILSNIDNEKFNDINGINSVVECTRNGTKTVNGKEIQKQEEDNEKCAFFAGITTDKTNLPHDTVIVFDDVKLNVGGCYSGTSGKFTAMEDGLYVFSWTILSKERKDFTSAIVKDSEMIAANVVDNDAVGDSMTGSSTVVVKMKAGEKISLKVYSNEGFYLDAMWGSASASVFSGYKI